MRMQPWNPVWIKHRGPLHERLGEVDDRWHAAWQEFKAGA
jgi:hypothetical protein